jgi:hypothetical protein
MIDPSGQKINRQNSNNYLHIITIIIIRTSEMYNIRNSLLNYNYSVDLKSIFFSFQVCLIYSVDLKSIFFSFQSNRPEMEKKIRSTE